MSGTGRAAWWSGARPGWATASGALCGAAITLTAGRARADFPQPAPWEKVPPERRSGLVIGLQLGAGVTSMAGFPNDPKKIGFQSYYTATGVKPGAELAVWIGGALSDWLNFSLGFDASGMGGLPTGEKATMLAAGFHVDFFPAYTLGGRWRDVALYVVAATGPVKLAQSGNDIPLIDAGAGACIGGGIFWEGLRWWHLGNGPFLETNYMWSESARRPAIFLGWRTALYTGKFAR